MSFNEKDIPNFNADSEVALKSLIKERIVIMDGAMGTMLQQEKLDEKDFAGECPKARFAAMIRIYVHHAARFPALHKIVLQESSYQSDRLEWLSENFLSPLADAAAGHIRELQEKGVAVSGDPFIIYNMVRVCSGTLIALERELKNSSDIDLQSQEKLDELSDLIVRVFFPGELNEV